MAAESVGWTWPWFSLLVIPLAVVGFQRGGRGAWVLAVTGFLLAALWVWKGCASGWVIGPILVFVFLPFGIDRLERRFAKENSVLSRRERELSQRVRELRSGAEAIRGQVQEREREIHEIVQLYELSKRFLATLEGPEALKIIEDSVARSFPQMRLAERRSMLQKIQGILSQGGELSAEDLVQAAPAAGSAFAVRERWGIVSEQLALGLQRICLYRKVQESATHDGLTGLLVRRYFRERLENEIARARRRESPLTFLMVDLDHFKSVNDTYGHLVGDVVLRETAALVRSCVREVDLIARYGGEELAVALPETGPALGMQIAERIRKTVEAGSVRAYDEQVFVTVSIGVSFYPEDGSAMGGLIEKADQAMYRAKSMGRNRAVRFSPAAGRVS